MEEAQKFTEKFNNSVSVFGPNYPLKVIDYNQVLRLKNMKEPVLKEETKNISLASRFNHLTTEDVVSQLLVVKGTPEKETKDHTKQKEVVKTAQLYSF